jgi:predicted AAA+ superfamily ATPase
MVLTEKGYKPRILDEKLRKLLSEFGAVSVEGPKWCGKTWTALNRANSVVFIADPAGNFKNRETARFDPSLVLEGKAPLLIDEWQEVPGLWDAVRFSVDRKRKRGGYILTGSSTPRRESYVHSGTGRIARLRMRTMSLFESGDSSGAVSLAALFKAEPIDPKKSSMTLTKIIKLTLRGGWPVLAGKKKFSQDIPRQYLERISDTEVPYVGGGRRDRSKVMAVLKSLARNNATLVGVKTIQKDIDGEEERTTVDRNTVSVYLELLKSLYVLEEIPGWDPALRSTKKLRLSPKRLLTDPSLAAAAIGATADNLKKDLSTFGFLFEGLCIRDILVYAELGGASVYHYRDEAGLEADAILELPDGRWGALEIKLGAHQTDMAAANLLKLKAKMKKAGLQPPSFLAVISGLAGFSRLRDDGVYVIPIDCLGA